VDRRRRTTSRQRHAAQQLQTHRKQYWSRDAAGLEYVENCRHVSGSSWRMGRIPWQGFVSANESRYKLVLGAVASPVEYPATFRADDPRHRIGSVTNHRTIGKGWSSLGCAWLFRSSQGLDRGRLEGRVEEPYTEPLCHIFVLRGSAVQVPNRALRSAALPNQAGELEKSYTYLKVTTWASVCQVACFHSFLPRALASVM
jgi:hypothetical protein